ncbi:hypothetical protein HBI56_207540 [Parastagonospora nodorum]|nr:hypothetical protein HBH56_217500 [Parastagonospora nodorum]KAH3922810.1 hypothetical protein HBH54_219360 [Parastagonospora nodorum]KAH3941180.1 hypothetical protein HBH53_206230 [Parastagonospora nodorum]KAH3958104.1 hypothetical protein HBH51_214520 [Parastagonospora nodorum]KAH3991938.1 hypothetical protein HBI10_224590 [Parastagonospora nodorum]
MYGYMTRVSKFRKSRFPDPVGPSGVVEITFGEIIGMRFVGYDTSYTDHADKNARYIRKVLSAYGIISQDLPFVDYIGI